MDIKEYRTEINGVPLIIKISELAKFANSALLAQLGETEVLVTVVMGKEDKLDYDFMPLTVDYEEKYYAAGKIYGSRFVRRESRPTETAILTGRLIDRTLRPLFDQRIRREIQITNTCLSIDDSNDPDTLGIIGSSLALGISDIPWNGPVAAIRIGWNASTGFIINPTYPQRENLALDIVVSGTKDSINMIEAEAKEVAETIVYQAFLIAQKEINKLCEFQEQIIKEIGKAKAALALQTWDETLVQDIQDLIHPQLDEIIFNEKLTKAQKDILLTTLFNETRTKLLEKGYTEDKIKLMNLIIDEEQNQLVHNKILNDDKRPDGRALNEIRPIDIELDILPRTHGSALFIRGDTQALSITTLGAPNETLIMQGMEVTGEKRYIHHYNFPGYCSGEISKNKNLNRREIGHGALAEKAVRPLIPSKEIFPYAIRVVTEILASNGSTSMASTCASSLSLMTAGVPIKKHAAGIAMGLIKNQNQYKILTDIQGPEDHYGDMDFKVAGTEDGITALQMDIKVDGLNADILKEVLDQAREARLFILKKMSAKIQEPRPTVSQYAPQIITLKIDANKIGEVIGSGGKIINQITEQTETQIDFDQDGTVYITGPNQESIAKAKTIIESITKTFEAGEIVEGTVQEIKDFGAIVKLDDFQSGLLHISELAPWHVDRVEDIVKPGDILKLKVKKVEPNGKISLSLKDITHPEAAERPPRYQNNNDHHKNYQTRQKRTYRSYNN